MESNFYKGNREKLYASLPNGTMLVTFSGKEVIKTADEFYPFFANRNFVYSVLDNVFGREGVPYGCHTTLFYTNGMLENLTMQGARIYTVILMAIPAVIAIVGAVIVIRRKNR